jgi:hypothetical protein
VTEHIGDPPSQEGDVGLDLARSQPVVNQLEKPFREIGLERRAGLVVKKRHHALVQLENPLRIVDFSRRLKLGRMALDCLGSG